MFCFNFWSNFIIRKCLSLQQAYFGSEIVHIASLLCQDKVEGNRVNHLLSSVNGQDVWWGRENRCLVQSGISGLSQSWDSGGSWCLVSDSSGSNPILSQEAYVLIFFFSKLKIILLLSLQEQYKIISEDSESTDKHKKSAHNLTFCR